jgi:hypothetical protein
MFTCCIISSYQKLTGVELINKPCGFNKTAHTARASMAVVRENFPGHVISQCGDLPWPARSPDLSVCDYFLWGYIKAKVFINKPCTVHELKVAIEHEIPAIPPYMIRCSMNNFKTRLQECIQRDVSIWIA